MYHLTHRSLQNPSVHPYSCHRGIQASVPPTVGERKTRERSTAVVDVTEVTEEGFGVVGT